ncbi:MAG: DUF4326 domain-containing protein [Cyanobacteria bacterium P01_H01_bin.130]
MPRTTPIKKYADNDFVMGRVWDCDIRCDRRTPYGNPFPMRNKSDEERIRVCQEHRQYLWNLVKTRDPEVLQLLQNLSDRQRQKGAPLRLGCHCSPKLCHCDTLARAVEWARSQSIIQSP